MRHAASRCRLRGNGEGSGTWPSCRRQIENVAGSEAPSLAVHLSSSIHAAAARHLVSSVHAFVKACMVSLVLAAQQVSSRMLRHTPGLNTTILFPVALMEVVTAHDLIDGESWAARALLKRISPIVAAEVGSAGKDGVRAVGVEPGVLHKVV
eukprot:scaffold10170_cov136-Isochrysis_galbana.AAC.2